MTNNKQDNESRLGHDPLEWLEDDIINSNSDENQADHPETITETNLASVTEAQEASAPDTNDTSTVPPPQTPTAEHCESASTQSVPEQTPLSPSKTEIITGFKLNKTEGKLTLPKRLSVQISEEVHQDWEQILDITDLHTLQINAEQLAELDTAGLQLLFSFSKTLELQSTKVTLTNIPNNILNIFKLAGLDTFFTARMEMT